MRTRLGFDGINKDRRQLLTTTAMGIVAAMAAGTVLATSAFAKSARGVRRHSAAPREPLPYGGYEQRWPGAKYDENGYYIDPNSPGRW
jgi:hypothetical protein